MTERPVEISQALFAALGLPSVPLRALERRLANLPYGASLDTHAASKGISTAPNERWKDKLDQQSLDLIAELCGANASIFGYDLRKPSRRKGFAGMVSSMPGTRAKAGTAAKLAYLALLERPFSKPGGRFPFQLINC